MYGSPRNPTGASDTLPTIELGNLPVADRAKLVAALEILPANDQLLLAMFYVEDFTLAAVALALDMTASDVLAQHAVVMVMIRGLLKPNASEDETRLNSSLGKPIEQTGGVDMCIDLRSVLNGEARLKKLLAIRKALDDGTYYVDNGELADALLQKAVLESAVTQLLN